jgi:hypothetical protein
MVRYGMYCLKCVMLIEDASEVVLTVAVEAELVISALQSGSSMPSAPNRNNGITEIWHNYEKRFYNS